MRVSPLILVIDDDEVNCHYLQTRLRRDGYQVHTSQSGTEALKILSAEPIQLVILDLEMPDMDGFAVLDAIRRDFGWRHVPVLMLSGRPDTEDKVAALERGADDFLPKPPEYAFLLAKLKQFLRQAPASALPLPGQTFSHFELIEVLGSGGMGQVFRARDTRLQRDVALKVMQFQPRQTVERFLREARAVSRLTHRNITTVYDVGELPLPYISMELVAGSDLEGVILPPAEAARVVAEVAETLHVVHEHGILHRDLKPSNVMVGAGGNVKILDFGLAKMTEVDEHITRSGEVFGTPHYMAAEHFNPELGPVDGQSDVYALTVTLYQILSGKLPFPAPALGVLITDILHGTPAPLPPTIPSVLHAICRRGLERDKSRRYGSAAELGADLRQAATALS